MPGTENFDAQLLVLLKPSEKKQLRRIAFEKELSMSEIARDLVVEYLKTQELESAGLVA